jgi:hypothetical protein
VAQGYDIYGKQIRKTTSYKPPEGVTEGKAEKLAMAYAYEFEKRCQGMVNMNENIRFSELAQWYYNQVAVHKLKPTTYANSRTLMDLYVLPYIGNMKLKEINTARIELCLNVLYRGRTTKGNHTSFACSHTGIRYTQTIARKSGVNMNTLRTLENGGTVIKELQRGLPMPLE